jgi:hypothetical protein
MLATMEGRTIMGRRLVPRFLAAADFSLYTDEELHKLVSDISLASTTSPLILSSPPLQECIARLATKDTAFAKANKKVDDDKLTLRTDLATEAVSRSEVLGEARTFVSLVVGSAKSPADIQGAALTPLPPRQRGVPPAVPELIENRPPKRGHGKTTVAVHETGPTQHEYTAQQSLDGITWVQLGVGHGKTRVVTGPSGTKVWVRFAMVRSGLQSEWSTPLLVTIP